MKSNRWDDHYTEKARKEKWLARSVYKLQEIDRKFKLIRRNDTVLDLGCFPGSWSQYVIGKVGKGGNVVGIDLQKPKAFNPPNFTYMKADIETVDPEQLSARIEPRNLVLSDLAPPTTGIRDTDASRSLFLAERAAEIARMLLKPKGHFVCKIFEDEALKDFKKDLGPAFGQIRLFRPKATRKRSREVYLVATGFITR
ncbi:ribosomal RNA large subunit methyltransferase J [delta proteobacterium NaphS2]|nr:ribosomal RNA large subunit methyltransferase J [delta proteobacterium NaphS2]